MKYSPLVLLVLTLTSALQAKIDLVTLPQRASVQLTIYNSADLTLARESRGLVLDQGSNKLQFSWAGTLIDPTSVELRPLERADEIEVVDTTFPGQKPQHQRAIDGSDQLRPAQMGMARTGGSGDQHPQGRAVRSLGHPWAMAPGATARPDAGQARPDGRPGQREGKPPT